MRRTPGKAPPPVIPHVPLLTARRGRAVSRSLILLAIIVRVFDTEMVCRAGSLHIRSGRGHHRAYNRRYVVQDSESGEGV